MWTGFNLFEFDDALIFSSIDHPPPHPHWNGCMWTGWLVTTITADTYVWTLMHDHPGWHKNTICTIWEIQFAQYEKYSLHKHRNTAETEKYTYVWTLMHNHPGWHKKYSLHNMRNTVYRNLKIQPNRIHLCLKPNAQSPRLAQKKSLHKMRNTLFRNLEIQLIETGKYTYVWTLMHDHPGWHKDTFCTISEIQLTET